MFKPSYNALLAASISFAATGATFAQGVQTSYVRGSDGCPEIRVQNNGRKAVDVDVEYTIQQRKSNGRTVGGTRTDTMDDVPPGGRARTFPTYVFGAACDMPYDFQQRVARVRER
jgi:hypothetical protein